MRKAPLLFAAAIACVASPAAAQSAREMLVAAAFSAGERVGALASVGRALLTAEAALAREARMQRALAIGYRGKLKRGRGDVQAARTQFEALVAANPRDAEAQMALAGWHLGAIVELGPLMARTALGARKERGLKALDAALAAGGGRAMFPAFASLNRIQIDPADVAGARALAEAAVRGRVARPEDAIMKRHAVQVLPLLRGGDGKGAAAMAKKLMPFGQLS
ncbi:MAG TPA: hypothetical protein VEZ48_11635 [Sphingomonadaceae bacterium]|nr:hypothetical protein [Sphingomonadaceae bacterium]